jgi:hypothetical protein
MRDNNIVYGGNYRTTKRAMMAAYDKLPPEARGALAQAVENWVPQPLLTEYRRTHDADDLVVMIRLWDMAELRQRAAHRRKARGPYRGNAPEIPP